MKMLKTIFLISLALLTWSVSIFHIGVLRIPSPPLTFSSTELVSSSHSTQNSPGHFYDKEKFGLNHIFLIGDPYYRGLQFGQITKKLMLVHEAQLIDLFNKMLPSTLLQRLVVLSLIRWFNGIEYYLDSEHLLEIKGVAQSSDPRFNYLVDPFTRQLAYHGIHEIGQMVIDSPQAFRGCTLVGIPFHNSWILGRNFDFEAGRNFDLEKVVKWVNPSQGYRFVSIGWSGMVGVVSGVNEHGVYISINAAGSNDFVRYGNLSTLVILKALQYASSAQ